MVIVKIVEEYLQILLNWPFLGACLISYFLFTYREEIRTILHKARLNKIGGAEFGQAEKEETALEIASKEPSTGYQNWEFKFYGMVIAVNTFRSLLWLHTIGSSTKMNFFQNMTLHPTTADISVEREAQFSILLGYELIEQKGELYKVTTKGAKLLKYYKFIS